MEKLIRDFMNVEEPFFKVVDTGNETVLSILCGMECAEGDVSHYEDRYSIDCEIIEVKDYYKEWSNLMPVLKKIDDLNYELPEDSNLIGDITHGLVEIDIEMTFEAVVKLIEFINEDNK